MYAYIYIYIYIQILYFSSLSHNCHNEINVCIWISAVAIWKQVKGDTEWRSIIDCTVKNGIYKNLNSLFLINCFSWLWSFKITQTVKKNAILFNQTAWNKCKLWVQTLFSSKRQMIHYQMMIWIKFDYLPFSCHRSLLWKVHIKSL